MQKAGDDLSLAQPIQFLLDGPHRFEHHVGPAIDLLTRIDDTPASPLVVMIGEAGPQPGLFLNVAHVTGAGE